MSSQASSTPGSPSTTTTYGYDAAGHVTAIAAPSDTQTLAWNNAGQLTSVTSTGGPRPGTTSYAYDADGSLLLQQDSGPGLATLYLAGEQLTETTGATPAFTSARYYALGGATVAVRTSDGQVTYLAGNQQGTATLAVNATTLAATRRYFDPYGNPVGAAATAWPGTKGFVGGTADTATGLTNLGAREYSPATTSFASPDSLLNPYDPRNLNAFAYSLDDPASLSDPAGTDPCQYKACNDPPPPPPCAYIGDCGSTLPPPGVAVRRAHQQ